MILEIWNASVKQIVTMIPKIRDAYQSIIFFGPDRWPSKKMYNNKVINEGFFITDLK